MGGALWSAKGFSGDLWQTPGTRTSLPDGTCWAKTLKFQLFHPKRKMRSCKTSCQYARHRAGTPVYAAFSTLIKPTARPPYAYKAATEGYLRHR